MTDIDLDAVRDELDRANAEGRRLADFLAKRGDQPLTPALVQASRDIGRDLQTATEKASALGAMERRDGLPSPGGVDRLRGRLADAKTDRGRLAARLDRRRSAGEELSEDDRADLRAADDGVREIEERLAQIANDERRAEVNNAAAIRAGVRGGGAPGEYRSGRPLEAGQSMVGFARSLGEVNPEHSDLSLGRLLRGLALGDWSESPAEARAMSGAVSASGGYLVPSLLAGQIIDLSRNATRVLQAGALTIPMASRNVTVARWDADPTPGWRAEGDPVAVSDPTIGAVQLQAHTLAGVVKLSRELLEDATSPSVEAQLTQAFAKVIAGELDRVALWGTGSSNEPKGIANTSGIGTASLGTNGAALLDYSPLIAAVGALQDNNEEATAFIVAPRTARSLGSLTDTTGQTLRVPPYIADVPILATNTVPVDQTQGTSSAASSIVTGDFADVLIGLRTQLQLRILVERYADTGEIGVEAWLRGDVAVTRPKAFHVTSGVL